MTSFSHHFLTLASKMNRRGHWVLLEIAKSGEKNHPKPQKIRSKPKPHAKPSIPINFDIPVIKTPYDPIQSVTSATCRGFATIRDQWKRIIGTHIEEKPEPKWEKL